jgi:hypothetical protein
MGNGITMKKFSDFFGILWFSGESQGLFNWERINHEQLKLDQKPQ